MVQEQNTTELSMADKVNLLGFNPDEFLKDILVIDNKLSYDYSDKNLSENVYPYLRILKDKYGMDIPLCLTGIDIIRLENVINSKIEEVDRL